MTTGSRTPSPRARAARSPRSGSTARGTPPRGTARRAGPHRRSPRAARRRGGARRPPPRPSPGRRRRAAAAPPRRPRAQRAGSSGLYRADGEHVVVRPRAGREDGIDPVRGDDDPCGRDAVELAEVALRPLRDRQTRTARFTACGTTRRKTARSFQPITRVPVRTTHRARSRRKGTAGAPEAHAACGERAPSVRSARENVHAMRTPASACQLERLDPVGDEVGCGASPRRADAAARTSPRARGGGSAHRLVARPLPPEDVGVEHDHLHASSRQSATSRPPRVAT